MCGIIGVIGEPNPEKLRRGLSNIRHRGPDGLFEWHGENISLGHARLAIIDTSDTGNQPMLIDGRYVTIFNGEIYNYIELKKELEKQNVVFKTNSDTEVLTWAYIIWKEKCLSKFNGMWAFAIYDLIEKSLFISRDRIGKKPLFYYHRNNYFAFGSEMKALYPFLQNVSPNWEVVNNANTNGFSYESSSKCLINGIERFPAGHYAYFKKNDIKINQFWYPEKETIWIPNKYEEQTELFKELFEDAVKIRMRSDVPIGTALSGGVDSSSVLSMMHYIKSQNKIITNFNHSFTASFPQTSIDETEIAKKFSSEKNISFDSTIINPDISISEIINQAYLFEEIYYASTIPFFQLYNRYRLNNIKVSIDGHGADELFAGYNFDAIYALPDNLFRPKRFINIFNSINKTRGIDNQLNLLDQYKFSVLAKFPKLKAFSKSNPIPPKYYNYDFLNSKLYESTYVTILPTLLRNYDRYSMANGVEIRMPFLDYRILKFAFSISSSSKIKNGNLKAIIKDAMRELVPDYILNNKRKIGFNSPYNDWLQKKSFKDKLMELLDINIINQIEKNGDFKLERLKKFITSIGLNVKDIDFNEGSLFFHELSIYNWYYSNFIFKIN